MFCGGVEGLKILELKGHFSCFSSWIGIERVYHDDFSYWISIGLCPLLILWIWSLIDLEEWVKYSLIMCTHTYMYVFLVIEHNSWMKYYNAVIHGMYVYTQVRHNNFLRSPFFIQWQGLCAPEEYFVLKQRVCGYTCMLFKKSSVLHAKHLGALSTMRGQVFQPILGRADYIMFNDMKDIIF